MTPQHSRRGRSSTISSAAFAYQMIVAMGGIDLLCSQGGIGEHQQRVRAELSASLGFLGSSWIRQRTMSRVATR